MCMENVVEIILYTTKSGKQPFLAWQSTLDRKTSSVILSRLARIRIGNFGDCKPITGGDGICELRIDYGGGYRIYYGKNKQTIVVLLIGGNKSNQKRNIEKAKEYWSDFKENKYD